MRERFKTFILCFLVFLSLVLTYRLLFGSPDYEAITPVSYEKINFGETVSPDKILHPEKIIFFYPVPHSNQDAELSEEGLLNYQENRCEEEANNLEEQEEEINNSFESILNEEISPHHLGKSESSPAGGSNFYVRECSHPDHYSIWEAFNRKLKSVNHLNFIPVNEKELKIEPHHLSKPSLQMLFLVPFPLELFLSPDIKDSSFPLIKSLNFIREEVPVTYAAGDDGNYYRIDWNFDVMSFLYLVENLLLKQSPEYTMLNCLVKDNEAINRFLETDEAVVPYNSPELPDLYFQAEELDVDKLARAFFIDLTLVRRIKERDEAVIYTDGQRGLRINSKGLIEYSAPAKKRELQELSYPEALNKGIEYVTLYGGWPEMVNLSITELDSFMLEGESYYRLKINSFYNGLPIIFNSTPLELIFNRQGLVSYQRQIFNLEAGWEKSKVIGAEEALERLLLDIPELFSQAGVRKVTRCILAYIPAQEVNQLLQPYWLIELDDYYRVLINARTGTVDKVMVL